MYDLDVTRNLPDCFGYLGVARQVAARPRRAAVGAAHRRRRPAVQPDASATVELVDGDRCARFTSTVISGIRVVTRRRTWIAHRLAAAGMRSDQQRRRRQQLRDARAQPAEPRLRPRHVGRWRVPRPAALATARRWSRSTGSSARSPPTTCLICDANDIPIGIGGIMGGLDSEISETTTTIALEMAWFEPIGDRQDRAAPRPAQRGVAALRARRRSSRHAAAIARFVELLRLTCPDLVVHDGMVDAQSEHLPSRADDRRSRCQGQRAAGHLAVELSRSPR